MPNNAPLFFIGNAFGIAWNAITPKTWNTFTSATQELILNNASEKIIHQYTFPSTIQCTVTVHGSHNGTQTGTIFDVTENSTPQVFYVQGGADPKYIIYELTFPGTIMNLNAYTSIASGPGGTFTLDSNEIVLYGQTNHTVEKHTVRFKVTAPSNEGIVDITLQMKNICRVPYSRLLFQYVVDNTSPEPSVVHMLHQIKQNDTWTTITPSPYEHDAYIQGWSETGAVDEERLVWVIAFAEPLIDAMNSVQPITFDFFNGTSTEQISSSVSNMIYTEESGHSQLDVYLYRNNDTDTLFDNVNRIDSNGLHIGADISVALQPVFDRAGNSYEYDSKSVVGTNPMCVLRVKNTIPQMITYDIAAVDSSIDYWDTASIPSGTNLDITVSFDCEVDIQSIIWKDMGNNVVTVTVQSDGTDSAFSHSATWRYTAPTEMSDIRFTLSNIKDRATNTLESVVIPPNTVNTANVKFGINGDYATSTIYSTIGDTVTLRIESNTPSKTPFVRIAGQTVAGPDVLGNIAFENGDADSSTMWTVSYTIPIPSNDVPPQGPASVFIRTENSAGMDKHMTAQNVLHIDTIQPTLSSITIYSSNNEDIPESHWFAREGDTVTLTIQTNEAIESLTGTWFTGTSNEISMNSTWFQTDANNASQWHTSLDITKSMPQGYMSFTVAYTDLSGNVGLDQNSQSIISEADVDQNVVIDTVKPVVVYYAKIPDEAPFTQRIENGDSVTFPLGYMGPLSMTFGPVSQWQNITVLENNTFLTSNGVITWTPVEASTIVYYEWSSSSSSYSAYNGYKLLFFRDGTVDFVQTLDTNQSTGSSNYSGPPSWNGHSSVSEIHHIQFDEDLRTSTNIQINDSTITTYRSTNRITFTTDIPYVPAQTITQDNAYNWNESTWEKTVTPIVLSDYFSSSQLQPTDVFFNGSIVVDTSMEIRGSCNVVNALTIGENKGLHFVINGKLVILASDYDTSNILTLNY